LENCVDNIIFTTEDYSRLFNFSKSKMSIVPIGVDTDKFKVFNKNASITEVKLPKFKFIVLFVGNLDIHNFCKKGVEYLLNAIPLIKKSIPNIFVDLVGVTDIETEKIISSICKKKKIENLVRVSGYVSTKDLPKHYSASNVLILPSISKLEAFGIVLIEAMASGLPIIASNIPGVRSVVKSSKAGFLVKPKSSNDLAKTIIKVSKLKNLDKYAIETANEKYNWNKITKDIENIYKKVAIKKN
jgi:glycosyltransferase involved in cell wall biosynthesis